MHQTAKGKQWYFGMKAHVGVDSRTKLVRETGSIGPFNVKPVPRSSAMISSSDLL